MKSFLSGLLFTFICLIFSGEMIAQSPALIGYQGTVRDDKGAPVINQAIALRFEILRDSPNGTVVYTDDQLNGLSTNGQGLFTTQIGKNGTLGQFDWQQSSTFYLRISIDPTGGNNLIVLGNPQQMVSVPYAMHAASVPATYTNNVLTVGTKSFNITMTPNTSLTVSGIGTVISTGTNSFDINIPAPTFSNTGQTIISGTYPNYSVNTPTVPPAITPTISITNTAAATSTVVSSGSSFSINVPPTSFTNTGQAIITGVYPNYSVNTPTVAGTSIALTATAAAGPSISTIGTNSFNLNIPPANGWSLLGNAGTSTLTNFIGTTDANELVFKINNQKAGRIENTSQSVYFGYLAGPNSNSATANTGVGYNALNATTNGYGNTGIGYLALQVNTSGFFNTAIGGASQWGNTTGIQNTSLGYQSLRSNITGNNNVVVGMNTLGSNSTGSDNTAIGFDAGYSSIGNSNVFIGYRAGYFETGSNKLYIANSTTSVSPLIYGDFATNHLGIGTTTANGELQFNNTINGRKIVLWEGGNNDHQVYAIGTNVNALRYQVDASVANHIFYAGINASSSQELMRIQGNRRVGINTAAPTATFEVTGTTKLVDGTQGAGKVLTSDAAGNATWQAPTVATTPSMFASGIASVSPATGYNFTVSVDQPTFAYSQSNGSLTSGTSSAFITPTLSITGNTLSSGPISNSVNLAAISPWAASGSSVILTSSANLVGIGTNSPAFKLDILGTSGPRLRVFSQDGLFAGMLAKNNTHEYFVGIQADYESAGGVTSGFHIYDNTANARRMVIDATGKMGIANSSPQHQVNIGDATTDSQIFGLRVYQATSSNANNWLGAAAFGGTTSAVVAGDINGVATIGGHSSNLSTWTDLAINPGGGNVGIGTSTPHAALQFTNSITNRKIVLWEDVNNDHQFYGFGINGSTLRYQTSNTSADHVFYAATGAGASDELFRIKGTGMIKMGTETGTGQGPTYPSGGGMMLRRLFTTNTTAGEVVARTDQMTFERDGTFGGFRITNTTGSGNEVCNCVGTTNTGVSFNRALNNLGLGSTAVYADGNNIVYFHCMFGDPYNAGHITEVTFTRQYPDYFWVGTVMTTFNQ